jgi:hypothetical protein
MSVSRVLRAVVIVALLLFATACGSRAAVKPRGTSSLALQSSAPVWGGDAQPPTTDVVRAAITKRQAKVIAKACSNAPTELPSSGTNSCEKEIQNVVRILKFRCRIGLLCFEVVRVSDGTLAQPDGFVQIVDPRPGSPLCSSSPEGLCFRLGAQNQVLQQLASLAPAGTTSTDTVCPSPTDTTSPTPTDTTSPTTTDTTSPTTTASPSPGSTP